MVMFGRFFLLGRTMSDLAPRKYSHKVWKKSGVCNMPYKFCGFFMEKTTGTYVFFAVWDTPWWDLVSLLLMVQKSCTSWYGKYTKYHMSWSWRVLYISGGWHWDFWTIDTGWWFERFNHMFVPWFEWGDDPIWRELCRFLSDTSTFVSTQTA